MAKKQKTYTKKELIQKLKDIAGMGWVPNTRHGNDGGVGNTLEDLLGIEENNLPIPNAAEWELKTQRAHTASLTTLFHFEPSPQALRLVTRVLLPNYGWKHKEAGNKYPKNEKSFRMTIHGQSQGNRGFMVVIDRRKRKVAISFDSGSVDIRHKKWLASVKKRAGLAEIDPQPYWGFDDLEHKAGTKLHNAFYVQAETKRIRKKEYYHYTKIMMLQKFNFDNFLDAVEQGNVLVDFDARTGHNHGTKFRVRQNILPMLYEKQGLIL